jgi:uncharacterized protein (TIGR03000 family)
MIPHPVRFCRFALAGVVLLALNAVTFSQDDIPKKSPATIIVKIFKDATLEIEGAATKKKGEERKFVSPDLEPGTKYKYTLVARWEPNNYTKITRTKVVPIKAGETVNVDMTVKDPKQLDEIVIRFVPTPKEVVEAMCKLADVKQDDVVFDLGCGDGRLVIMAVEKFGAKKGIGVDLDPERIKESKENAKNSKVEDKLEFREGDVFKVPDLEKASVILLYMSDELGEQLGPILRKRLKPGSRIVSHRFLLGDWKPEKTETMEVDGEEYKIHLWKVEKKE